MKAYGSGMKNTSAWVLLAIRLYWGVSLLLIGIGHLVCLRETGDYLRTLHLPYFLTGVIALVELAAGLSWVLGFYARYVSLFLILFFSGASLSAKTLDPLPYLTVALVFFCFGSGALSLKNTRLKN